MDLFSSMVLPLAAHPWCMGLLPTGVGGRGLWDLHSWLSRTGHRFYGLRGLRGLRGPGSRHCWRSHN